MTSPTARSETHSNPYAADGRADNYAVAVAAGADPQHYSDTAHPGGEGNHFWVQYPGWAPTLTRDDYSGTPDPTREEELPRVDRRANLRNFWGWWAGYDADVKQRESVTQTQAVGWTEQKGTRGRAPHPLWTPPQEPRPTTALSPHRYTFQRPFDQVIARMFNGAHFSFADNRRAYPILLQSPVPVRRNTYRIEPGPWDTDIVDEAPDPKTGRPDMRLQQPPLPTSVAQRSYRLG
jgi:hypothetical protein